MNSEQHQVKRAVKGLVHMGIVLSGCVVSVLIIDAIQSSLRPLNDTLVSAVENGDQKQVCDLLNKGADPNYIFAPKPLLSQPQRTPVILMAQKAEIAQILLDRGARIDATDAEGKTALDNAVQFHNTALIRFLQSRGAHE